MLLFGSKTVTVDGITVFPDHADPNQFWYLPGPVALGRRREDNRAAFTLIKYKAAAASAGAKGGGFLTFETSLRLTPQQEQRILSRIPAKSKSKARLSAVSFDEGTVQCVALNLQGSAGTVATAPPPGTFNAVEKILGATVPSLHGDNIAAFSLALSQEGAIILEKAFTEGTTPVGVVYNLKFTGIRPALSVKITADFKRIYTHFSASLSAKYYFVELGIEAGFEKLRQEGAIQVNVTHFTTDADKGDKEKWALDFFKEMLLKQWFEPTLAPGQLAGGAAGAGATAGGGTTAAAGHATPTEPAAAAGGGHATPTEPTAAGGAGHATPTEPAAAAGGGHATPTEPTAAGGGDPAATEPTAGGGDPAATEPTAGGGDPAATEPAAGGGGDSPSPADGGHAVAPGGGGAGPGEGAMRGRKEAAAGSPPPARRNGGRGRKARDAHEAPRAREAGTAAAEPAGPGDAGPGAAPAAAGPAASPAATPAPTPAATPAPIPAAPPVAGAPTPPAVPTMPTAPGGAGGGSGAAIALKLKFVRQEELKTLTFEYNSSQAVQRTYAPQGFFGLLLADLEKNKHFVEVDLDDPFFRVISVTLDAPFDFEKIGLSSAHIALDYGRPSDPANHKHKDFVVDSQHREQQKWEVFMNSQRDTDYGYGVQYHFDPTSGWEGEKHSYELPARRIQDRTLLLNPWEHFDFREIRVIPHDLDPGVIESTDVHLEYQDSKGWKNKKTLTVMPTSEPQFWKLRLSDPTTRTYRYRFVHHFKDGSVRETQPVVTDASAVAVTDPFQGALEIVFFPAFEAGTLRTVFVDVQYDDPENGYTREESLRIAGDSMDEVPLRIALVDPKKRRFKYRFTFVGTDGKIRRGPFVETEDELISVLEQ